MCTNRILFGKHVILVHEMSWTPTNSYVETYASKYTFFILIYPDNLGDFIEKLGECFHVDIKNGKEVPRQVYDTYDSRLLLEIKNTCNRKTE